jgi:hypothetical protein
VANVVLTNKSSQSFVAGIAEGAALVYERGSPRGTSILPGTVGSSRGPVADAGKSSALKVGARSGG